MSESVNTMSNGHTLENIALGKRRCRLLSIADRVHLKNNWIGQCRQLLQILRRSN